MGGEGVDVGGGEREGTRGTQRPERKKERTGDGPRQRTVSGIWELLSMKRFFESLEDLAKNTVWSRVAPKKNKGFGLSQFQGMVLEEKSPANRPILRKSAGATMKMV